MTTAISLPSRSYSGLYKSYPVLSAEQEHDLAVQSRAGDLDATKLLILHNIRFVQYVVRGYRNYGLDADDLMQAGIVGLMKAIKVFQPERGVRLISHAVVWIKSEINEFVINNYQIVRMATTKAQRKLFFNLRRLRNGDADMTMTSKEVAAIAKELEVSEKDVRSMESRFQMGHGASLNMTINGNKNGAEDMVLQDMLIDPSPRPDEAVMEQDQERLLKKMHEMVAMLPDRERDIIIQRRLNSEPTTLIELAKKHKVSAERIRQIEEKALKMLRAEMFEVK